MKSEPTINQGGIITFQIGDSTFENHLDFLSSTLTGAKYILVNLITLLLASQIHHRFRMDIMEQPKIPT